MEKFFNIKCRYSGLRPDCTVIVATVRALKMHGGGPAVQAGKPLDAAYTSEQVELVAEGCSNLAHHIASARKFGVRVVVAINRFESDTDAEIDAVAKASLAAGAHAAVESRHFGEGGRGAVKLAEAIEAACSEGGDEFKFLYPLEAPLREKIEAVTREIYGAEGVDYTDLAASQLDAYEKAGYGNLPVCMAKTQYSLSTDASKKGAPTGHRVTVREVRPAAWARTRERPARVPSPPLCPSRRRRPIRRTIHRRCALRWAPASSTRSAETS